METINEIWRKVRVKKMQEELEELQELYKTLIKYKYDRQMEEEICEKIIYIQEEIKSILKP